MLISQNEADVAEIVAHIWTLNSSFYDEGENEGREKIEDLVYLKSLIEERTLVPD